MKEKLAKYFQSKTFKKITLALGILFFILTSFTIFNPKYLLKFGYLGMFILSLFGPSTFLVPIFARSFGVVGIAFAAALGMALNDSVSWVVGRSGDAIIPHSKNKERIEKTITKYGPYALFFWSLLPFPYDIIGLIAGYLHMPYKKFIIPTFLGKFVRFLLMGTGTIALFGKLSL